MIEVFLLRKWARQGLEEDLVYGDRTTELLFPHPVPALGKVTAKEALVVAGLDIFQAVFTLLDPAVKLEIEVGPGERAEKGAIVARLSGDGRTLLKGERTALNFLQRLSGIATQTRRFVEEVRGTPAKIIDTRKTTPGFRAMEKEAVRWGGGWNHRFHLGDLVLIKDNHIALAKGLFDAVRQARASLSHPVKIEVEVTTLRQVEEALQGGADIIMLDNMGLEEIKEAVGVIRKKAPAVQIEVSGGIRPETVAAVAKCGVDLISIGALTHSSPAVDLSLEIEPLPSL